MRKVGLGMIVLTLFSFSSCKNCVDCTGVAGQKYEHYCKSDYKTQTGSEEGWQGFKNALRASGCKGTN